MTIKVLVFGTFDLFNSSHEAFLKRAKEYGDTLQVVISRDKTVEELKGEKPMQTEMLRLSKIQTLNYVDEVVLGSLKDKYAIIEFLKPDIIVLRKDQKYFTESLEKEINKRSLKTKIVRLKESFNSEKQESLKPKIKANLEDGSCLLV